MEALRLSTKHTQTLCISVTKELDLAQHPRQIEWDNGGLVGVIPLERVVNIVQLRKNRRGLGMILNPLCFNWVTDVVVQQPVCDAPASRGRKPSRC